MLWLFSTGQTLNLKVACECSKESGHGVCQSLLAVLKLSSLVTRLIAAPAVWHAPADLQARAN
jgi:hypothetical protein